MGRYIDDILQPGEKVLYSTNAHWIFYLPAIAAWIVALVFLILCAQRGRARAGDDVAGAGRGGGARCAILDGRKPGSTAGPPKPT